MDSVVEAIRRHLRENPGNNLIYCPSLAYLDQLHQKLTALPAIKCFPYNIQSRPYQTKEIRGFPMPFHIRKVLDFGTTEPWVARHWLGIFQFRDFVYTGTKRLAFDQK